MITGLMKTCSLSAWAGSAVEIQDEKPERKRNLIGGQADPFDCVHQLEHRSDGFPQSVIDLGHRPRDVTERGMRIVDDPEARR